MKLELIALLIAQATVTSYRSVPAQTDSSPFYTSTGEHVHPHGVAVSQDLLSRWGGPLNYGDTVYIEGVGLKVVNDCTNERLRQHLDVWVGTHDEEKDFDRRHRGKRARIWVVHPIMKGGVK